MICRIENQNRKERGDGCSEKDLKKNGNFKE